MTVVGDDGREALLARIAALEAEVGRAGALLAEANHRIGNDLATVGVLLATQARRSTDAAVKAALDDAGARVRLIAEAQRRLRLDMASETVRAADVLDPALDLVGARLAARGIALQRELADLAVPGRDALGLAIIAHELAANAMTHAFPDGGGRVTVRLDGAGVLTVEDDGRGLAAGAPKGMGTGVVESLARGLGASVRREDAGPGLRVIIGKEAG